MFKSIFIFCLPLALSCNAQAAFVDQGTYFTDTITNTDWLKISETQGKSYRQVETLIANGSLSGWRFATGYEFEKLLNDFGAVPNTTCVNGRQFCTETAQYVEPTKQLLALEGSSGSLYGFLADPGLTSNSHWYSTVINLYRMTYSFPGTALIDTHHAYLGRDSAQIDIGSYLVRQTTVSEVPLPAAIGSMFSGLCLLLLGRKRNN